MIIIFAFQARHLRPREFRKVFKCASEEVKVSQTRAWKLLNSVASVGTNLVELKAPKDESKTPGRCETVFKGLRGFHVKAD